MSKIMELPENERQQYADRVGRLIAIAHRKRFNYELKANRSFIGVTNEYKHAMLLMARKWDERAEKLGELINGKPNYGGMK